MIETKILTLAAVTLIVYHAVSNGELSEIADSLTTDERDALKQFRQFALKLPNEDFMKTDPYLVRWLRAFDFDLETTLERFQKNVESRAKQKISGILGEEFPLFIQEEFPISINSYDLQGRPVGIVAAGKFNTRKIALRGQAEIMHRFGTMLFELMEMHLYELQCSGAMSETVLPQITTVIDLAGISMANTACFICVAKIPKFIDVLEGNYPSLFHRCFIINVPRMMETVLKTLIAFASAKTQDASRVFGLDKSEWSEALLKEIPFDQLPVAFGGSKVITKNPKQNNSVWDWNNPALEGIISEFRQTNSSTRRDCIKIDNSNISTEDTPHRHRHHHGEQLQNEPENRFVKGSSAEDILNVANKNSDFDTETKSSESNEDWFVDNSWIDEVDNEDEVEVASKPYSSENIIDTEDHLDFSTSETFSEEMNYTSFQSQRSGNKKLNSISISIVFMVLVCVYLN